MKMSSHSSLGKLCLYGFILISIIEGCMGEDVIVLIVDYNGPIYKVNVSDGTNSIVYRDSQGAENVAYDPVLEHVYWSNLRKNRIYRVNLNGQKRIQIGSTAQCQGMVVDPLSRLMFLTDNWSKEIKKLDLKTEGVTVLGKTTPSNRPHDITADIKKQKLYWTVLGASPQIEMSDYDGRNRETLYRGGLVPTAVALDSTGATLFWVDEHGDNNNLMAIHLNKGSTSTVPYGRQGHLYDIDILNTTLYIIDRHKLSAYLSLPETGGTAKATNIPSGMSQYRHIKVFAYPYECPAGRYGSECEVSCGHCLGGLSCMRTSGRCPADCVPGWRTSTCSQECPDGTYGAGCTIVCGKCLHDKPCSKTDGRCDDGCTEGWTGKRCDQECKDGYFGVNCSIPCGQCKDSLTCDKSDGQCITGCQSGWTGPTCHDECPDGTYGAGCTTVCGKCLHDKPCSKTDGRCDDGCTEGWTGKRCDHDCIGVNCDKPCPTCNETLDCGEEDRNCSNKSAAVKSDFNYVPVVASVCTVGVVVLALGMLGVYLYLKRRQSTDSRSRGQSSSQPCAVVYSMMGNQTDLDVTSQPPQGKDDQSELQYLDMAHEVTFRQDNETDSLIII